MQLESFRIMNFRSINDCGDVEVSRITALLGRNESGKSNLLLGLCTLNPVEGFVALNSTKDFPRHRRLTDSTDETPVVSSRWRLNQLEQRELIAMLPRASSVTHIEVGRYYAAKRWVKINLPPIEFNQTKIQDKITKIVAAVSAAAEELEEAPRQTLEAAATNFSTSAVVTRPELDWAKKALPAIAALRRSMAGANVEIPENQDALITEVDELAHTISTDEDIKAKVENWATTKLPKFIYLAEYPDLSGHQDVAQYIQRKAQNQLTKADKDFAKLCKVAGLDIDRLHRLQGEQKSEERNQLANRASAVVTSEIRKLWKDRELKIRFNLDASHFETLISDPTSTYDVEVNLDERSRGFRWFFSFYITFAADTDGGAAKDAILLLDEPGLHLHIQSQKDLLDHWQADFDNQIIYTTHSPFMVPVRALDRLRTVNISELAGTTVTNDPTGDARTLAPIRAALGYHYADTLFIAANNLIVEGVTDWWILEAASTHIVNAGRPGLPPGMAVCPVDGAPKVPPMVSLLTSQKLNVLVLFDEETQARTVYKEMVTSKLIREENVMFASQAFGDNPAQDADIEDLIDAAVYERLARESYASELEDKNLQLNSKIPRIVKRLEAGFENIGVTFHKTRVAGLFFRTMAKDPSSVMTPSSLARFEKLFELVRTRLDKSLKRQGGPFR